MLYIRYKTLLPLFLIVIFFIPLKLFASNHYSFEHAEEMRVSGRIEWRDYGPDAFSEAIEQNKPIFLILTAPSWCYWCHVYTSDDYIYNSAVYPTINEQFIPIYVDADKRQDLTRQFLEGGWPSTTVMTPSRERLFGYSGPRPISFMITNLQQAVTYVQNTGFSNQVSYDYVKQTPVVPTEFDLQNLIQGLGQYILRVYDPVHGGFGNGQKFPQGRTLDYALDQYEQTGNKEWLDVVLTTLKNQYTEVKEIETNYNLFDPVEGGFHRYGTTREWSPPHYEKMLYDNARLLKAYFHLRQVVPDDVRAKEVVQKTLSFIENNWYDLENGGFYGNSDVHGEDDYYGNVQRTAPAPRVEKTKYSDWNSDAIVTYLYLYDISGNTKYKEMAQKSLDFFAIKMVDKNGANHYIKEDGTRGVQGSLLDNAYLLLAFTQGYEFIQDENYLKVSRQLADFSLENLYDWNSGGFFERHSLNKELYAPGEHINLEKPVNENGIITFALLALYKQTNDPVYLNTALKTFGIMQDNVGGLDNGYYYIKSAEIILENNLLTEFVQFKNQIELVEKEQLKDFWVNNLLDVRDGKFTVSETGLNTLQGSFLVLIIVAFLAGILSFVSPCTLPILPAYLAYTFRSSRQKYFPMTAFFFLGLSLTFTILGMSATLVGSWLKSNLTIFSQVSGALIIIFGIVIIFGKGFSGIKIKPKKPTTFAGSFLFGAVLGISWTPCVGPILVAILLLASTASSVAKGGFMLFIYSIGLALPLILLSYYIDKVQKQGRVWKILKGKELYFSIGTKKFVVHSSSLIAGIIFIILGYLIFSGILFTFNKYIVSTSFQKWFFGIEEFLLNFI